jgi:UDP-N-acetylglucosamine:LPS N-acetylglucosamine transferase
VIGGSQGSTIFDTTIASAVTGLPRDLQEKITLFQQVREENNAAEFVMT